MENWTAARLRSLADGYVREVLSLGDVPDVNELASRAGMTTADFSNFFFARLGMRPSDHIKRQGDRQGMVSVTDQDTQTVMLVTAEEE
ncbi:MAG TPA: hypothetical protein VI391_07415 [Thermoanaerobaculia bacterium]